MGALGPGYPENRGRGAKKARGATECHVDGGLGLLSGPRVDRPNAGRSPVGSGKGYHEVALRDFNIVEASVACRGKGPALTPRVCRRFRLSYLRASGSGLWLCVPFFAVDFSTCVWCVYGAGLARCRNCSQ